MNDTYHGLRTPNEDKRNLKIWPDVADKTCFGRKKKLGLGACFTL